MNVIFETDRLFLQTFTTDDSGLIYNLNLDPDITRYTHDPVRDIYHAKEILDQVIIPQYILYNYGRWAVHIKPMLTFIGWCGLKYRPEKSEIDLGYRIKKEYWGQAYATEAAFACIRYGFEKLGIRRIVGRAGPENIASCKVLEKCGMEFIGIEEVDGYPVNCYEVINQLLYR